MSEKESEDADRRAEKKNDRSPAMQTFVAYARGAGGALIVGLQLIFTMEMWWSGFNVPVTRIMLLVAVNAGILLILQHYSGLHPSKTPGAQLRAAIVAYGIGVIVATLALLAINVIDIHSALRDVVGKIALEAVPLSVGASV